jgi:hypothetical protein
VQEDASQVRKRALRSKGRRIREGAWDGKSAPPQARALARILAHYIAENNPTGVFAQATQRLRRDTEYQWAIEINDINELDGIDWADIERAIHRSQRSGRWQTIILGARSLRENWTAVNSP